MIAAALGMLLGCSGIDPVGGMTRLTFGDPNLLGGVPLMPALIAFFAVSEMLVQAARKDALATLPAQRRVGAGEVAFGHYLRNKWLTAPERVHRHGHRHPARHGADHCRLDRLWRIGPEKGAERSRKRATRAA